MDIQPLQRWADVKPQNRKGSILWPWVFPKLWLESFRWASTASRGSQWAGTASVAQCSSDGTSPFSQRQSTRSSRPRSLARGQAEWSGTELRAAPISLCASPMSSPCPHSDAAHQGLSLCRWTLAYEYNAGHLRPVVSGGGSTSIKLPLLVAHLLAVSRVRCGGWNAFCIKEEDIASKRAVMHQLPSS